MVGIVHNRQADAGGTNAHEQAQAERQPWRGDNAEKDQRQWYKVQREHEYGFDDHFCISVLCCPRVLEIFVGALAQRCVESLVLL